MNLSMDDNASCVSSALHVTAGEKGNGVSGFSMRSKNGPK